MILQNRRLVTTPATADSIAWSVGSVVKELEKAGPLDWDTFRLTIEKERVSDWPSVVIRAECETSGS